MSSIVQQITPWGSTPVYAAHLADRAALRSLAAQLSERARAGGREGADAYRSAQLVALVSDLYGVPYWWSGELEAGSAGVDCTGLSSLVLDRLAVLGFGRLRYPGRRWGADLAQLPRATSLRPGDQLLYSGDGSGRVTHAATWLSLGNLLLTTVGGGPTTHANDPASFVTVRQRGYWPGAELGAVTPWL